LPGFAKAFAVAFDSGFEDFGFSAAGVARLLREDFVKRFASFAEFMLMAIWLSLASTTASCAATDTSPAIGQGEREGRSAYLGTALQLLHHAPFGAEVERNVEQFTGYFGRSRQ
jgi:hypothetical protein